MPHLEVFLRSRENMLSVVGRGKLYKNDSFLDLKLIFTS